MVVTLAVLVVWGLCGGFFLRGELPHQPSWIDSPHRPLYVAHGLAFAAWMALLVAQAALVESGNVRLDRRLGRLTALSLGDIDPTQLLLVPMPWQDLHSLGRIHPATLRGGIALLAVDPAMAPPDELPGWQALLAALFG